MTRKPKTKKTANLTDKSLSGNPKSHLPKAVCDGDLTIGDVVINCAVLEDGTRILSRRKIFEAMELSSGGMSGGGKTETAHDKISNLPRFLKSENLQPYVDERLRSDENFIEFIPLHGGRTALGMKAEALPMICDVFMRAAFDGNLKKHQMPTAVRCRILQSGFAHLGIVALVDEATGYQDIRAKNALAKILEEFLSDEVQQWTKTFPLEFYREIYRLRGWEWTELENGKKPPTPHVVGKYTDYFVYMRIGHGVLDELRKRNPDKKVRYHQWFDPDRGHPKLKEHIAGVVAIMKLSDNWEDCLSNLDKVYPIKWQRGTLFYNPDVDEEGYD